jgi:hypothetical protein
MIIYCEECGFKNTIAEERIKGPKPLIPCEKCGDFLRFYGLKAKALKTVAPEPEITPGTCLILKYGNVVVVINEAKPRVEIGRQKNNDIQVINNRVSRTHAIIELKNGQYYLTDQSSNGTYLLVAGSKGTTVRKKTVELTENSVIGPGYKVDPESADAIQIKFEPIL